MPVLFTILAVTASLVLLWGLIAPRSQWRALTAWSVADPHRTEPGAGSYAIRRLVSALGLGALAIVLAVTSSAYLGNLPGSAPTASRIQVMWGAPNPTIVNRDVSGIASAAADLIDVPILGYQAFAEGDRTPEYLDRLAYFKRLGTDQIPGFIGTQPEVGFSAMDNAALIVNVRGALLCVPRQAVIIETETTVQIGIFYGLPDSADGLPPDNATACALDQSVTASVLVPLRLVTPVGDRDVQALDGSELKLVELAD